MKSEDRKPAMVVHTYNPNMEQEDCQPGSRSKILSQKKKIKTTNKKNQMGKKNPHKINFKKDFICMLMCVNVLPACVYLYYVCSAYRGQHRVLAPLEMELQIVLCHIGCLQECQVL